MDIELHAVLVGIERWRSEKLADYPLEGCLNDVALLERTLIERFDARSENIRVLRNEEATREAIVAGLRERLIETARRWVAAGRPSPEPAFVFHFSGHGSEANDPTGTQPNGRDQTIVPYDSRTPGVFDLKDWELGQLLDELSQYSANVTVLLDCCHSGSGTRSTTRRSRACPADDRRQPFGRKSPTIHATKAQTASSATRSAPVETPHTHVLVAACAAHQEAFPYDDDSTGARQTYGMLSYAIGQTLAEPDARSLSYRELHGRIARRIKDWGSSQTPQCEGDRDRLLFRGQAVERDLWWQIVGSSESSWTIDAGAMHGLSIGDLLDVFPPGTRARSQDVSPSWQLKVTRVAAITCETVLVPPRRDASSQVPPVGAAVGRVSIPRPKEDGDDSFRAKDASSAAHTQLNSDRFLDPATFGLINPRRSALAGQIQCEVHRVEVGAARRPGELQSTPIPAPVAGDLRIAAGTAVCFQFTNGATRPLYLHAFYFGYDGSITRIYPKMAGEHVAVEPGRSVKSSGFRLKFATDESPQVAEVREGVKLFASVLPCDLDSFGKDSSHRALRLEIPDDWTTVERTFLLIR